MKDPAPDRSSRKARGRKESSKSALTRKGIVDGAAALFAERGYKLTTLNDIAETIGVHLTGLYYHYDNKEELAADIRDAVGQAPSLDPRELFAHVFAQPTSQLREQQMLLEGELALQDEVS